MRRMLAVFVAGLMLAAAMPVRAHHAEPLYDMKNPSTVRGVVGKVDWGNPHVYLYLSVKNDRGGGDEWSLELTSSNSLQHYGWKSDTVKPGDEIACTGGRSKARAKTMRCATIELPDGRKLRS
jgi:Family of unknown function (DUF6152)